MPSEKERGLLKKMQPRLFFVPLKKEPGKNDTMI